MAGDRVVDGWTQFFLEVEKLFEEIERKKSCPIVSVIEGLFRRLEYVTKNVLDVKERLGIIMTEPGADGPIRLELSLLIDSLLSRVMIITQNLTRQT